MVLPAQLAAQDRDGPRNVVLIMLDGLRWQEVFGGADSLLLNTEHGGIADTAAIRSEFWRPDLAERRRALLPFIWDSIARQGQLLGDTAAGSIVLVTNRQNFSYPGYNEVLAGAADLRINTNAYPPNPNLTVFEWLSRRPGFEGKVAAFGTWDAFPRIFNRERAGFHLWAGWEPPFAAPADSAELLLNELARTTTRIWDDLSYDAFMQVLVRRYVEKHRPRVLFIGYGETDVWAHGGEYGKLLRSARQTDAFIAELWAQMQRHPEYRRRTAFIITTDHGRGGGLRGWRDHGSDVPGADRIWVAAIGPGIRPLGSRRNASTFTQAQLAATIAALVGEDFRTSGTVAPPIADLLPD